MNDEEDPEFLVDKEVLKASEEAKDTNTPIANTIRRVLGLARRKAKDKRERKSNTLH